MSSDFVLQPEVEELLVDMAKQPGSTLLGIERPPVRTGYLETLEPASNVGSSAIERELLRVYREDVVFLLLHTAMRSFHDSPPGGAPVDSRSTVSGPNAVWDREQLTRASRETVQCVPPMSDLQHGLTLLADVMGGRPLSAERVVDTALALLPRPISLQYKAITLVGRSDPHGAIHAAQLAMRRSSDPVEWSHALDIVGLAHATMSKYRESSEAYKAACSLGEPRTMSLASWFTAALAGRNLKQAREALRHLDDVVNESEASLVDYCQQLSATVERRTAGVPNEDWDAIRVAAGPTGRRVLDALL